MLQHKQTIRLISLLISWHRAAMDRMRWRASWLSVRIWLLRNWWQAFFYTLLSHVDLTVELLVFFLVTNTPPDTTPQNSGFYTLYAIVSAYFTHLFVCIDLNITNTQKYKSTGWGLHSHDLTSYIAMYNNILRRKQNRHGSSAREFKRHCIHFIVADHRKYVCTSAEFGICHTCTVKEAKITLLCRCTKSA